MKKLFAVAVVFTSLGLILGFYLRGGSPTVFASGDGAGGGVPTCSSLNGDVNASGAVDLSDAVTILGNLFLGNPTQLVPLCASSNAQGLPDTGQRQCYDCSGQPTQCLDCTGRPRPCGGFTEDFLTFQDSMQRTGCPNDASRFTVVASETVVDNCTGLEWQIFTADTTGDGVADRMNWCSALDYCKDLVLGGHADWRLPNVRELESIVDYGQQSPAADPVLRAESRGYWSCTSISAAPELAWGVDFMHGVTSGASKNGDNFNFLFVRAVRGGL